MIIGIGNDLVDIRRIEKALTPAFEKKIFSAKERALAQKRAKAGKKIVAATYAKRYAAKEACVKALGGRGMSWHDIEITNTADGAPEITLSGGALRLLKKRTPKGMTAHIFITITDEYPMAFAQVIIEAQ